MKAVFKPRNLGIIVLISVLAVTGSVFLLRQSKAASYSTSLEIETGQLTAPARSTDTSGASAGKAVVFGNASTGFSFTAAGDHGNGSESMRSMDAVGQSGSQFYLALGDLSYAAGQEDEWCAAFKSRLNDIELIAGNHDTGENSGGDINRYRQFCPFTLGQLTGDYGKQYYFDYPQQSPLARFIMIAPGVEGSLNINYNNGGAGYTFTQSAIDSARAAGIKWIVVGMHKNCISVGAKLCETGTDIMNLLVSKKVDLVLQSHDHNYQRTHALSCFETNRVKSECIADNGSDGAYVKGRGTVTIINGEFGRGFYEVKSSDSEAGYFAKMDGTTFGITKYQVTANSLSAQYLRSGGASFADSFVIAQ